MSLRTHILGTGSKLHRTWLGRHYGSAVVLMYHRIAALDDPAQDPELLRTSPELFAAQLDAFIQGGFQPFSLGEAVALLSKGRALPQKAFCLTFDDGYLDNFTTARTLLEERRIPATFFVATAGLESTYSYGWEHHAPESYQHVDAETLARTVQESSLIEIGGHTHTHPRLSALNEDAQRRELVKNQTQLAELCGKTPRLFAYPYGQENDFNETSVRLVREVGYRGAACTTAGILSRGSDLWRIRRIDVHQLEPQAAVRVLETTFSY